MEAVEALAIVSGHVEEELLIRNEYLAAENQILKSKLKRPVHFNDNERIKLSKIGKRLELKALKEISCIVKPETILKWFRKLVAKKFDGSSYRKSHGRPPISLEIEKLIIQFAEENLGWGYDRIAGALSNLGHKVSDQTVGNVLKRNGILPAPSRTQDTTWATFIKRHQNVIAACDFFTTEVITPAGLVTYYVLFFIHHSSRKVHIAGITPHPNEEWMKQIARNVTMADYGFLSNCKYLIHDRDSKFCKSFCGIILSGGVKPQKLPPRSPNLNAICERWGYKIVFYIFSHHPQYVQTLHILNLVQAPLL
jgi:putative transposase